MKALAIVLGIIFLILTLVYFTTPAGSLPGFLPGHIAGSAAVHHKHAFGAFVLALACFAFVWFQGGKKSQSK